MVNEKVLWLNVSVADPQRVYVGEAPEQLVRVQLDENRRDRLLGLYFLATFNDRYIR